MKPRRMIFTLSSEEGENVKIRGITVEIGGDTSGLSKALKNVNSEISSTQKELKDVERLLKMDPGNTELLRQKYELLNKSVDQTETKLDALKQAEKEVQQQFERGDVSEAQYNAIKREIESTQISLRDLRKRAEETDRAIKGVDEKPIEEVANAADKAEKELKEAGKEASSFGDHLKAEALVAGAQGLLSTMKDVSEESKELNTDLSRLEQNALENGVSAEKARDAWREFAIQSGETDSAVEATSNLLQAGFTESNLEKAVNGLAGAAQRFPDTLKVESLADSLQETLQAGAATGQFAELLDRVGVGAENFSEKLEKCSTDAERQNLVLQALAETGLNESYEGWKKNNEALYENNEANLKMQEQLAELGEKIMPIITQIIDGIAVALEWFNNLDEDTQKVILTVIALVAAIGPLISAFQGLSGVMSFIAANPIVLLIAAIVGLVALIAVKGDETQAILQRVDDFLQNIFARDWTEVFGPVLGDALNAFFANLKNIWDSVMLVFDGVIDFIRGVFTGDWERAWTGVQKIFAGIFEGLITIAKAPLNSVLALINGMIEGINWVIRKANSISFKNPFTGEKVGFNFSEIGKIPYLAKGGILTQGSAVVGEAGPELLTVSGNRAIVQPLTGQSTVNNSYLGGINVYVYGAPGQDVKELAEMVADEIQDSVNRKGAAYA